MDGITLKQLGLTYSDIVFLLDRAAQGVQVNGFDQQELKRIKSNMVEAHIDHTRRSRDEKGGQQ